MKDIFPKYWIIKAGKFNNKVSNALDEWIYFLKNSEILDGFSTKRLLEAKEKLDELTMTEEERRKYQVYLKYMMNISSEQHTKQADLQELLVKRVERGTEKGKTKEKVTVAKNAIKAGLDDQTISALTALEVPEIQKLREEKSK